MMDAANDPQTHTFCRLTASGVYEEVPATGDDASWEVFGYGVTKDGKMFEVRKDHRITMLPRRASTITPLWQALLHGMEKEPKIHITDLRPRAGISRRAAIILCGISAAVANLVTQLLFH